MDGNTDGWMDGWMDRRADKALQNYVSAESNGVKSDHLVLLKPI